MYYSVHAEAREEAVKSALVFHYVDYTDQTGLSDLAAAAKSSTFIAQVS